MSDKPIVPIFLLGGVTATTNLTAIYAPEEAVLHSVGMATGEFFIRYLFPSTFSTGSLFQYKAQVERQLRALGLSGTVDVGIYNLDQSKISCKITFNPLPLMATPPNSDVVDGLTNR